MFELNETHRGIYSIKDMEYRDGSKVEDPLNRTIEEEVEGAKNLSFENQAGFIVSRLVVLDACREIVNEFFQFNSGVEFGCGAYGWMYNFILPRGVDWRQFDINPNIVKHNREFTKKYFNTSPYIEVGNIYDMPFGNSSIDVIAGFSTWDSIIFFRESFEEIWRCLKPNGYFVHFQDLLPPSTTITITESKMRIERGLDENVPCGFYTEVKPHDRIPGITMATDLITHIYSREYGHVRLGEYLHRHMARLLREMGFDIKLNQEVKEEVLVEREAHVERLKTWGFEVPEDLNCFGFAYGKDHCLYYQTIPEGKTKLFSAMDVLIAQKK